jgi:hypothetical protein
VTNYYNKRQKTKLKTKAMKVLSVFLALFLTVPVFAQQGIPAEVKTAFSKKYPTATDSDWFATEEDYEVDFTLDEIYCSATYSAKGTWIRTTKECGVSALPNTAVQTLKQKYKDGYFARVVLEEQSSGESIFAVNIEFNDVSYYITLSAEGKILTEDSDLSFDDDEEY